jgi:hypothetical protein
VARELKAIAALPGPLFSEQAVAEDFKNMSARRTGRLGERKSLAAKIGPKSKLCTRSVLASSSLHSIRSGRPFRSFSLLRGISLSFSIGRSVFLGVLSSRMRFLAHQQRHEARVRVLGL